MTRELLGYVIACEDDAINDATGQPSRQFAEPGGWTVLGFAIQFRNPKEAVRRAKRRHVNPTWRVAVFELWRVITVPSADDPKSEGRAYVELGAEVWPDPCPVERLASLA